NIEPVYTSFLSCLEDITLLGIKVAESQGGYIYPPEFESGSRYMPFSSELNFVGNSIPYWYYVSGNNIEKERVPSKSDIEEQLERYINENVNECVFNEYKSDFLINHKEADSNVNIFEDKVVLNLNMDLNIQGKNNSVILEEHNVEVKSFLGKLYDSAKEIYDYEQQTFFLENYGIDVLRLYAPVDGVELDCSPLVWNSPEIFKDLKNALESNILSLKGKNNNYKLKKEERKYFIVDVPVEENVNFIYSSNWPTAMNVEPSDGPLLMSEPVGNQAGLGALGFCYNTYHFVYDLKYPVLIQVSTSDFKETFQFPFAVVIKGNNPRESLNGSSTSIEKDEEFCDNKNTPLKINLYDSDLNPVNANISFECLGTKCDIGKTKQGQLVSNFSQCINGKIIIDAKGYKKTSYTQSTVNSDSIDILLDRLYKKDVKLKIDNQFTDEKAIIDFISKDDNSASKTIVYPEQDEIELSNGEYKIRVSVYENSSIELQEKTTETCYETPSSGLGGLFGLSEEECIDVEIPPQIISNVLVAGGSDKYYVSESQLQDTKEIHINAFDFPKPETISDLQINYNLQENQELEIDFK
ncbi:MAG: hypothetical protein ACOC1K_00820, partial [Nanoarchaeota archaeon]